METVKTDLLFLGAGALVIDLLPSSYLNIPVHQYFSRLSKCVSNGHSLSEVRLNEK